MSSTKLNLNGEKLVSARAHRVFVAITSLSLCTALTLGLTFSAASAATAQNKVIPPSQWWNKPEYSPDGSKVAVTTPPPKIVHEDDSKVQAYDDKYVPTRKKIVILNAKDFTLITDIESEIWPSWSPDGKYICASNFDRQPGQHYRRLNVSLYDASNGAKLKSINDGGPGSYAWSPDSKRLCSTHIRAMAILDIEQKQETLLAVKKNEHYFALPKWSHDGNLIAACLTRDLDGEEKKAIRIWDANSKEEKAEFNLQGVTNMFAWSPNGKLFIYSEPLAIKVLDAESKKAIAIIKTRETKAVAFGWSHDKTKFSYHDDGVFHILDASTMKETAKIIAPVKGFFDIEWSPDSNFILISASCIAAICDAKTGKFIGYKTWPCAGRHTISPDQKLLIVETFGELTDSEPIILPPAHGISPFKDGKTGSPNWD
jgi:WD40 repeat protein